MARLSAVYNFFYLPLLKKLRIQYLDDFSIMQNKMVNNNYAHTHTHTLMFTSQQDKVFSVVVAHLQLNTLNTQSLLVKIDSI